MAQMKKTVQQVAKPINFNVQIMNSVSTSPGNAMEGKTAEMAQMKKTVQQVAKPINFNVQIMNSVSTSPGNAMEEKTAEMGRMKKTVQQEVKQYSSVAVVLLLPRCWILTVAPAAELLPTSLTRDTATPVIS